MTKEKSGTVVKEEDSRLERIRNLPVDEFVSRYIPTDLLDKTFHCPPLKGPSISSSTDSAPNAEPEGERKGQQEGQQAEESGLPTKYSFSVYSPDTIPQTYFEGCFDLIEYTSSAAYKASPSFRWSCRQKREEMSLHAMMYLIVRDTAAEQQEGEDGRPTRPISREATRDRRRGKRLRFQPSRNGSRMTDLNYGVGGFISFMPTEEEGVPVLYLYEIHIHPRFQNRGIGTILMQALEDIARNTGILRKTMLTVFRSNEGGRRFYERLGYRRDEESTPSPMSLRGGGVREPDYYILYKDIN